MFKKKSVRNFISIRNHPHIEFIEVKLMIFLHPGTPVVGSVWVFFSFVKTTSSQFFGLVNHSVQRRTRFSFCFLVKIIVNFAFSTYTSFLIRPYKPFFCWLRGLSPSGLLRLSPFLCVFSLEQCIVLYSFLKPTATSMGPRFDFTLEKSFLIIYCTAGLGKLSSWLIRLYEKPIASFSFANSLISRECMWNADCQSS